VDSLNLDQQLAGVIVDRFKPILKSAEGVIKEKVGVVVAEAVDRCPEVESMRGSGSPNLQAELGFIAPQVFITSLLDGIKRLVYANTTLSLRGKNVAGGMQIGIKDFTDLLKDNAVKSFYESEGGTVEWLNWLLTQDSNIIIADYAISYGSFPKSRSRQAIMVPTGSYQIPPQFSGNPDNNFLTRAITPDVEDKIRTVVNQEIEALIR
jgi:hypothetical protein